MNSFVSVLTYFSSPFSKYGVHNLTKLLATAAVLSIIFHQLKRNYLNLNQSENRYFNDYASAIIGPLPTKAILLINYDQLWTSARYIHVCENFRTDVTIINLSMMTFKWFHNQQKLYANVKFPGHLYHSQNGVTLDHLNAYTISSFIEANIDSRNVFITGKLSYPDQDLDSRFDLVPYGLTQQVLRKPDSPSSIVHMKQNNAQWLKISKTLPHLPDLQRYPEETWEWTIARDYIDKVTDTAAYRLSKSLEGTPCSDCLIEAVYFLESAVYLEKSRNNSVPTFLLKNLGLGHVHLIQSKEISDKNLKPPRSDHFNSLTRISWPSKEWKSWSSDRFVYAWGSFLKRKDAKDDPQYNVMKNMYKQATKGNRKM